MNYKLKNKQIQSFDPNGVGKVGSLFGLPFSEDTSEIVVIPVPWDVTTSFNDGASSGPASILKVSPQIDLFIKQIPDAWKLGIYMLPIDSHWEIENKRARALAKTYISFLEGEVKNLTDEQVKNIISEVNDLSDKLNQWVYNQAVRIFDYGKKPIVLGGEHSVPLGLMKSCASKFNDFGVLQIDAHADLRISYENFEYSHASIMRNMLKLDNITRLVQVGIRDFCEEEYEEMQSNDKIVTFYDHDLTTEQMEGRLWKDQVDDILNCLPDQIYISLDIDGLQQNFCPNTGTPVPGGLIYSQLIYLFERIMKAGIKIISFDICEVAGNINEWDAIVGSRILYYLANVTAVTNGLLE